MIGIDLFTGAGGLSLGFEQAGFDIRYAVENDIYAAETYRNNRKNKDLIVDVKNILKISPRKILSKIGLRKGEVGIVIGGPPCQGFSISNMKTRNMDNPQNHLIFKFIDFVKGIKPKWFLMENVAGLDTFKSGLIKEQIIKKFRRLGYTTDCIILNAVNYGVPQSRKRIFFIGTRTGGLMDCLRKLKKVNIKIPVTVSDAISDLPHLKNGHNIDVMHYNGRKRRLSEYQIRMRKKTNGKVSNNLVSRNTELVLKRYNHIRQGENLLKLAKKKPSLVTNYKNVDNCHHWIYLRLPWNKPAVTINNYRKNMLIHPGENRGLSVREAARLQSFPDNYAFYGPIGFQQQQVANAVPPVMAKKIAKCILHEHN